MEKQKALFLDRDGVLNKDWGYVYELEKFEFVDGAVKVLKKLQEDYKLIIVTNQGAIAYGKYSLEQMNNFNNHLVREYLKKGINFDAIYYCPHARGKNCKCRKPNVGMFEQAMKEFDIDMNKSWTIGDKLADCIAGKSAGTKTVLLNSKYVNEGAKESRHVDFFVENLNEVKEII